MKNLMRKTLVILIVFIVVFQVPTNAQVQCDQWQRVIYQSIWEDVCYGNGNFVAVGKDGNIGISKDGKSWSYVQSGENYSIDNIVFGNNTFVCVGSDDVIRISKDGISWTAVEKTFDTGYGFILLDWSGESFYTAVKVDDVIKKGFIKWGFYSSSDGINWTEMDDKKVDSLDVQEYQSYQDGDIYILEYTKNDDIWVGIGVDDLLYYSEDSKDWNISDNQEEHFFRDVIWNGKQFVAVGNYGQIFVSNDGLNWENNSLPNSDNMFRTITWDGKKYRLFESYGSVISSIDAKKWELMPSQHIDSASRLDFFYTNNKYFISVADDVYMSSDGVSWSKSFSKYYINDITSNGKIYVAVGNYGSIVTSTDGAVWTNRTIAGVLDFNAIIWDGKQFLAVNEKKIFKSKDGIKWNSQLVSDKVVDMKDIIYNGKYYLIYDLEGNIYTSNDTIQWVKKAFIGGGQLDDGNISWNGYCYVLASERVIATMIPLDIIKVVKDGTPIAFDSAPVNEKGSVLVPMRAIFEAFDADVTWDQATQTVIATAKDKKIELKVNSSIAIVNGKQQKLDIQAKLVNGSVMVPIRFISENLNCDVKWIKETNSVQITSK